MKKQELNDQEKETMSMINKDIHPTNFFDSDTPKPDGGQESSGEGEDEDEKPGGNIFK